MASLRGIARAAFLGAEPRNPGGLMQTATPAVAQTKRGAGRLKPAESRRRRRCAFERAGLRSVPRQRVQQRDVGLAGSQRRLSPRRPACGSRLKDPVSSIIKPLSQCPACAQDTYKAGSGTYPNSGGSGRGPCKKGLTNAISTKGLDYDYVEFGSDATLIASLKLSPVDVRVVSETPSACLVQNLRLPGQDY